MKQKSKAQKAALYGMLVALAFIFSYLETLIPFTPGLPGVKLGLANLIVVTAFYTIGYSGAFTVSLVRILLSAMTFQGLGTMLYSLAGGILSFAAMSGLKKSGRFGVAGISLAGGIMHNIGQLLMASLIVSNLNMMYYIPVLLVSGCITGMIIGMAASWILKALPGSIHTEG